MLAAIVLLVSQAALSDRIEAATSALRERRFSEALAITKELTTTDGKDARLWTLQGFAHAGLQEQQAALGDFRRAVALSPDYLPALKAEAQIEYATHDERCSRTLGHIIELQPNEPVSHAMRAALAYQRRDCKTVVADYAASETYISSQPPALSEFGQCLFQTGQKDKGVEQLRKAVALEPSSREQRYNLAVAELSSGHAADALAALEPLLASGDVEALDLASGSYEQIGNTPKAVETLRQAIIREPSKPSLYLHFADLCFAHNSFQVGIDMVNAGLQKVPGSAQLYLARGILFVQLGKYEEAEKDFDKAAELDPSQSYSSVARGLTQLQQSNLDQALAIARAQLKQNPKDGYLWYVKAETLRQRGVEPGTADFQEAFAAAQKALELKARFPLAEDLLGSLYLQKGQFEPALKCFKEVIEAEPNNESAIYHMIVASRRSRHAEAVPDLMKRLARAKVINRKRDEEMNRYTFVEPAERSK